MSTPKFQFVPFEFPTTEDGKYFAALDTPQILLSRREQLGFTMQQVADLAGIQFPQYQRLESGERPLSACSMRIGLAVCAALLLDPYDMVPLASVHQPPVSSMSPQQTVNYQPPL